MIDEIFLDRILLMKKRDQTFPLLKVEGILNLAANIEDSLDIIERQGGTVIKNPVAIIGLLIGKDKFNGKIIRRSHLLNMVGAHQKGISDMLNGFIKRYDNSGKWCCPFSGQ